MGAEASVIVPIEALLFTDEAAGDVKAADQLSLRGQKLGRKALDFSPGV